MNIKEISDGLTIFASQFPTAKVSGYNECIFVYPGLQSIDMVMEDKDGRKQIWPVLGVVFDLPKGWILHRDPSPTFVYPTED